jgi:hypothetical protein
LSPFEAPAPAPAPRLRIRPDDIVCYVRNVYGQVASPPNEVIKRAAWGAGGKGTLIPGPVNQCVNLLIDINQLVPLVIQTMSLLSVLLQCCGVCYRGAGTYISTSFTIADAQTSRCFLA